MRRVSGVARVGVYYAPAVDDPLWTAGCAWLGWDAARGVAVAQPDVPGLRAATDAARLYGFHATLKAPFRPVAGVGVADVVARLAAIAAGWAPVALPTLRVGQIDSYMALVAEARAAGLQGLADDVVAGLEDVRAPLNEAELARRRGAGLTAEGEAMLARWGYPEVFGAWRFHMTLAGPLGDVALERLGVAAKGFFAGVPAQPRVVRDLCVVAQPATGVAFRVVARVALGKIESRRPGAPPPSPHWDPAGAKPQTFRTWSSKS